MTFQYNEQMAFNALHAAKLDLNNPAEIRSLIQQLEVREFITSEVSSWVVLAELGTVATNKLSKAFGKNANIGKVLSYTKEEVASKVTPGAFKTLVEAMDGKGLKFSTGCIYCGASTCIAHRYGESTCGYDYNEG